jgi:subtilisin family serine protease
VRVAAGGLRAGAHLPTGSAGGLGADPRRGQTVAVIDTGVSRHRLLPNLIPGGDYVSSGDGAQDCDGHGTIVAGIIGAGYDPGTGFTGIAPDAAILTIRQSSMMYRPVGDPGGSVVGDVATLAAAVRSAADQGATVINISSVACLDSAAALDDRSLGAALAYAVDVRNAVIVTAAGNVGGTGTCPRQNPLPIPGAPGDARLGSGAGGGEPQLVRRPGADRRFGGRRRAAVTVHPGRTVGGRRRGR